MKKIVKLLSFLLCLTMLLGVVATTVVSAAVPNVTGVSSKEVADIKINGRDTGIDLTQMLLTSGSAYAKSTTGLLNVIEIPAKDPNVTMAVLNGGSYTWSQATMGNTVVKYNQAHNDSTVIAAVNGDPWMLYHTDYDGDGKSATGAGVKHKSVSRGLQIIDGEIWATRQMDDENNLHTTTVADGGERGSAAAHGPSFGVLADGSFIIGKPNVSIYVENDSRDTEIVPAGGINRLPAPNSIVIYNQRCGTESFAFADAYEVYLECDDTAFNFYNCVGGTVTAIFESGSTATRPAIDANTVVLSARGTAIAKLKSCGFQVGDSASVTCMISGDAMIGTQRDKWYDAEQVISGFFTLLESGRETGQSTNTTKYPCSIIGLKADGTAVMLSTTPQADGTRSACRMMDLPDMCKELGIVHAILFDGGGSTEMITIAVNNTYVRRSATVDGTNSVRGVINGLAVVYKGSDMTIENKESNSTAFLPDSFVQAPIVDDTPGITVTPPEADTNAPEGDEPAEILAKEADPSYAFRYMAAVESINGQSYTDLKGMRDPAYTSSLSVEEKLATIKPAIATGVTLDDSRALTLAGWALVNGGQGTHYWSLDKKNWYPCTGTFSNATSNDIAVAGTEGKITVPVAEKGRFADVTVDLSAFAGETVTVYFGVEATTDASLCHYLTVENVAVPAVEAETQAPVVETEEGTEAPTEAPTEEPTEAPTEESTEESTEATTEESIEATTEESIEAPTEAPTEDPTEAPTEAPTEVETAADTSAVEDPVTNVPAETEATTNAPETQAEDKTSGGCGATVLSAPVLLLAAGGALTLLRKKRED